MLKNAIETDRTQIREAINETQNQADNKLYSNYWSIQKYKNR